MALCRSTQQPRKDLIRATQVDDIRQMTFLLKSLIEDSTSPEREEVLIRKIEESSHLHQVAQSRIAELDEELGDVRLRLEETQGRLETALLQEEGLRKRRDEAETEKGELLGKVGELEEQLEELNAGVYQYQKQCELLELKQEQLERDLELRTKHIKRLESLLDTRRSRLDEDSEDESKAEDLVRPLQQFKDDFRQMERRLDESLRKTERVKGVETSQNLFTGEGHPVSPSPIQRMESIGESDIPEAFLTESKGRKSPDLHLRAVERR